MLICKRVTCQSHRGESDELENRGVAQTETEENSIKRATKLREDLADEIEAK